jgi:hypothetical protein
LRVTKLITCTTDDSQIALTGQDGHRVVVGICRSRVAEPDHLINQRQIAEAERMGRCSEPKISIVIPARNEARNLEVVLPELPEVDQVVVVDGQSVDGTLDVARQILPNVTTVEQTRRGKGNALACGFEAAFGDIVIMFDADGSADPAEIPNFVNALTAGGDFAKGTRFQAGGGSMDITVLRRAGNAALNQLTNRLFHTRFTDLCYGYNAMWRDIVPSLGLPPVNPPGTINPMPWGDGFEIETVINCRIAAAGLKIVEVPSVERERIFGDTNLRTFADGSRVLRTIMAEYFRFRGTRQAAVAKARAQTLGEFAGEEAK